jgi:hypothetical protein
MMNVRVWIARMLMEFMESIRDNGEGRGGGTNETVLEKIQTTLGAVSRDISVSPQFGNWLLIRVPKYTKLVILGIAPATQSRSDTEMFIKLRESMWCSSNYAKA